MLQVLHEDILLKICNFLSVNQTLNLMFDLCIGIKNGRSLGFTNGNTC